VFSAAQGGVKFLRVSFRHIKTLYPGDKAAVFANALNSKAVCGFIRAEFCVFKAKIY